MMAYDSLSKAARGTKEEQSALIQALNITLMEEEARKEVERRRAKGERCYAFTNRMGPACTWHTEIFTVDTEIVKKRKGSVDHAEENKEE